MKIQYIKQVNLEEILRMLESYLLPSRAISLHPKWPKTVLEECECLGMIEETELCERHLESNLASIFYSLCDIDLVT